MVNCSTFPVLTHPFNGNQVPISEYFALISASINYPNTPLNTLSYESNTAGPGPLGACVGSNGNVLKVIDTVNIYLSGTGNQNTVVPGMPQVSYSGATWNDILSGMITAGWATTGMSAQIAQLSYAASTGNTSTFTYGFVQTACLCNNCTYADIKNAAGQYMYPVQSQHPTQPMSVWYSNFLQFQQNMWNNYLNGGCNWWYNRINHWGGQLSSGVNTNGNPLSNYQTLLLQAKVDFAMAMITACGCAPPPPIAPPPMTSLDAIGSKTISSIDFNFEDIPASGGEKTFKIKGDVGAQFYMEIKNEDGHFYNDYTKTFASDYKKIDGVINETREININVKFPTVTDNDQYDIYVFAKEGTSHVERNAVLFRDGSIDLNRSVGSNNNFVQKVLYQILDVDLVLSMYSSGAAVPSIAVVNKTITSARYKKKQFQPFSITATRSSNALTIDRQPKSEDVLTFIQPVVGSAPVQIPGENIYPSVTGTDTVNGAVTSGTSVTMDTAVASTMKVGDRITGNAALNAATVTVVSLDSTNVFTMSQAVALADGLSLSFSNQVNYRWPVDNVGKIKEGMIVVPDTNVVSDTEIAEYKEIITLFENTSKEEELVLKQVDAVDKSKDIPTVVNGLETVAPGTIVFNKQMPLALAGDTLKVGGYGLKEVTRVSGWEIEFEDLKVELNEITTTKSSGSGTSMVVASAVGIADETTQTVNGAITLSKNVVLDSVDGLFVGQTIYAVSSGSLSGNPTITTINENTKTITISSDQTFADGITITFANSIVSGPGITAGSINPYVTNISGTTLTLSSSQTLENNQTFKFANAGNVATLTGNIKINKVGSENLTLRFDVDRFLTYHS